MTDDIMLRVPFVHSLGPELRERKAGYARMTLTTGVRHAASDGTLHGGVLTTLMDSSLAIALRELRGAGASRHSSVEMNTTYLAPVAVGDAITIEGRITQVEPAVAFGEAETRRDADGALIAMARVTFAIQQERV